MSVHALEKRASLAGDVASAPRQATATGAAATAYPATRYSYSASAASGAPGYGAPACGAPACGAPGCCAAASAAAPCCTASAASATSLGELQAFAERLAFPVEDVERRQADVGDFLLVESEHGRRCDVVQRTIRRRRNCRRCAARHRQGHPGGPQCGQGCRPTLPRRRLFRVSHSRVSYPPSRCSMSGTVW